MEFNSFLGLLLYHLIISNGVTCQNVQQAEPPEIVSVTASNPADNNILTVATLKLLRDSFLANQNLPVWIAHAQNPNILEPLTQVMKDIGPFSLYRGMGKCTTAAVHSHRRQQFEGTIGTLLFLHEAHYDPETNQVKLPQDSRTPLHHRHRPITLEPENPPIVETEEIQKSSKEKWKYVQSRLSYPRTVYIEILVFVNHDVAKLYKSVVGLIYVPVGDMNYVVEFDDSAQMSTMSVPYFPEIFDAYDYALIVYHVLVSFNTVDALFSRAETPEIKINVAGIIIGNEPNSFPDLVKEKCYQKYNGNTEGLHSGCAIEAIRSTLKNYYKIITIHDYDAVIFFTTQLIGDNFDEDDNPILTPITGDSTIPVCKDESYEGYQSSPSNVRVALIDVHDVIYFYSVTLAHELAHLLNAYHDLGEYRDDDGRCTSSIMRHPGDVCEKCFHFSDDTLQQFTKFFSSRDGCIFRNEPKSLNSPLSRPKLFWDQDQQCQCYGYEHAYEPPKNCFNCLPVTRKQQRNICRNKLKCVDHVNGIEVVDDTTFLMDGTPCRRPNKVCWDWKCE